MEKEKTAKKLSTKAICFTAIMAALIFVFTFTFKIPLGTGYTHLGDAIIFLSVPVLGAKKVSLASGIGAALGDLIGGYTAWIAPTFFIKLLMVLICGLFAERLIKNNFFGYIAGAIAGGVFQIGAYTLAKIIMYDKAYALTTLPELIIQTVVGVAAATIFISVFNKTGITKKLRKMAE